MRNTTLSSVLVAVAALIPLGPATVLPACIIAIGIGVAAAPAPVIAGESSPNISDAQWIWDAGEAHARNCFLMVRKRFSLEGPADSAVLHITASDRYVLYVNGDYVGRGPARSDPRFKSYDTYQVGERLRSGKNALAVLAYHCGQNTAPGGPYLGNAYAAGDRAGLWAKLQVISRSQTIVIASGPDWLLTPALGWKRDVPPVNPLVGFPEWYDARRDPVDWTQPGFDDSAWQPATVIHEDQRPWKSLEARDVPMMRETEVFPVRIAKTGEVTEVAEHYIHGRFMKEVHLPLERAVLDRPESLLADDGRATCAQATVAPSGEVREPFVVVDFGRQVFGFPRVKMNAPEGAAIDMITSPHFVNGRIAAGEMRLGSRYVARAGEQTWQHFEYRQFRYLQIAVRSRQPIEIESVSLNAYQYPAERRGRFECSDPVLTKLWTACVDTAYLQMEDVLAIDAWRERVNWIACDIIHAILAGFGDTAVVRRHYRMISRVDLGGGVLPIFFPPDGHIPRVILQGNLIWIAQVEFYYQQAGDREFLAEHYPACKRQMDWFDRILDQDGLITDMPMWNWFDWSPMDKRGTCLANNALYLKALDSCAAMADVMNDRESASRWRQKAERVRGHLRTKFWNDERGLFEDAFVKGAFTGSFSEMANGLALWCDIATPEQIPRIVSQYHVQTPQGIATPTPIHIRFILWGLIRAGHLDKAVELMRGRYREMIEASDAPTIWELWTQSPSGTRSLVHGGNIPALVLSQEVLGIKTVGPGFQECRIEVPDLESIDWARGVLPSVRGDIGVQWRKEGRQLTIKVDLPPELRTTIAVAGNIQPRAITLDGKPVSAADLIVVGGRHQVFIKGKTPPRKEARVADGQTGGEGRKVKTAALVPVRLRCEYLANPLGIDTRLPRLSWALRSDEPGQKQTAYRILVASTEEQLDRDGADLWDSGKVESAETVHVPYAGKPLASGQRCYWKVITWQKDATVAGVSEAAWWEMGLLDPSDWKGEWIAGPEPCPYFRKVFTASRPVRNVRLYICGQGVYEARLNGKAVSDQVLGPQLSYYPKRMLYDTFDVTSLMKQRKNVVAVWLAPGWFGGNRNTRMAVIKKPDGPGHALIAQLVVRYADGTEDIIGTDQGWKTELSPLEPVKSHWVHCYQGSGERFDAEKAPFGWDTPEFDDTAWADAREIKAPTERLCARMIEPNRIVETVRPVSVSNIREPLDRDGFAAMAEAAGARNWSLETMTNPTFARRWKPAFTRSYNGHGKSPVAGFEVDFGKHVSGWVRMNVTGNPGDTVTMFGLDQHHLSGRPGEEVGQRFMHRAFRYVPIHFSGKGQRPKIENIRALAIQNDLRRTGRFECSDPTLNKIHDVAARTWAVHMLSGMPRDSWRERLGTALIENTESSFYWCDMGAFYTKWMTDHRDVQRPDGYLAMSGGPIAYDYWSPNWGKNAIVLVPWLMYLHYGDRQILDVNYPAIERWLKLCVPKDDTGRTWQPPADHGHAEAGYGDHGRPTARWYDPHTGDLFETLHTIDCFRMAEQIAHILGKTADAKRYRDVQSRLAAKCNRAEFLDRGKGLYGGGDQGCHALAICLNVAPPPLREKVAQHLISDIMETRSGHLNTGFLGTWYLLKALTLLNRSDVALRIITNSEPPSWATLLKHPDAAPDELTLLPEFFGKGMIPHPGWCSMGFWCYQALGGITPDPEHPGFERVIIRPRIARDLTWVKAEYDSIRGTIASHWTLHEGHFTLTVTIPPNTTALLYVPATDPSRVKAPGGRLVKFQRMEGACALYEIASGTHRFESDLPQSAR